MIERNWDEAENETLSDGDNNDSDEDDNGGSESSSDEENDQSALWANSWSEQRN